MRKAFVILLLAAMAVGTAQGGGTLFGPGESYAQEDWRAEFDDVCSGTQDAMSYSAEELRGLVERCDALRPRLEKLQGPQRKVYLRRLKMCRDLYAFVLEQKENE